MTTQPEQLPFSTRLWFAFACFVGVLFDGAFAARAWRVRALAGAPPEPKGAEPKAPAAAPVPAERDLTPALQLLALLQREGRLLDFLEQDVAAFSDADIGAAVRVVHEGCRKALRAHVELSPIRPEEEGARVTIAAGFPPAEVKLTGNVHGSAPYTGTLVHRGFRASKLSLPVPMAGHDAAVVAPAEVELA